MSLEEQLALEGVGWDGDLAEMRTDRLGDWDVGPDEGSRVRSTS